MPDIVQGDEALQRRFRRVGEDAPVKILRQFGLLAVRFAKAKVPRKTGNLGRTIRVDEVNVVQQHVRIVAGGSRNVGYAAHVEFGTSPHIIVPRRARALAWGGSRRLSGALRAGARPTHFARRVRHPGTRAKPYLVPGALEALRRTGKAEPVIETWNRAA